MPIKNLQDFYRKYYQPDNCLLVIAGKFDQAKAMAAGRKVLWQAAQARRASSTRPTPKSRRKTASASVTLRRVGDVGLVAAAYHIPSGGHRGHRRAGRAGQHSGRCPRRAGCTRRWSKPRIATDVPASAASWHDPGVFEVEAEVRKGDSLDAARDILLDVTEKSAADTPFTEDEVEPAKQQLLKPRELAAADTSRIAVQLSDWASQGDWRLYFLHRDRIEKVTPKEVQQVAEKYLRRENRTLGMFIPTDKSEKTEIPDDARPGQSARRLQGPRRNLRRRGVRRLARQHRRPHASGRRCPKASRSRCCRRRRAARR